MTKMTKVMTLWRYFDVIMTSNEIWSTLREETLEGRNFGTFGLFWSFSPKFMLLKKLNHQNAKVFSLKNINISQKTRFSTFYSHFRPFSRENAPLFVNSPKFFPLNLFLRWPNVKVFRQIWRFFMPTKVSSRQSFFS